MLGSAICNVRGSQDCTDGHGISPGGVFCCLSTVANCGQPDATTFVCSSGVAGVASCQGAPELPGFTSGSDDDASYSAGCKATLPVCNNGHAIECMCGPNGPGWNCVY